MTQDDSRIWGVYYGWFVVAALLTIWTVVFGIQYAFGIFFRTLQDALGCSRGEISLAMTIHLLAFAGVMIPSGWAVSRFNVRIVYALATLGLGFPLVLCSRISELWELYLLYGLMGISTGIYGPSIFTLVTHWFTTKRGLALGLASSGAGLGTLISAPLTNALIHSYGWRDSFVILGVGSFCILLTVSQVVKNYPSQSSGGNGSSVDRASGRRRKPSPDSPQGMTFKQALRTRELLLIIVGSAAAQMASRVVVVHIAPHATDLGVSSLAAAMSLSIIGFGSILGRIVMGFIQDRIGARNAMIGCLVVMGVSLLALPLVESDGAFFLFAVLFGFAFGGDVPQVPALTVHCFGVASMGLIYGLISSTVNVGSAFGPSLAGCLFDVTGNYTAAFLGAGLLLLFGAFSISRVGRQ